MPRARNLTADPRPSRITRKSYRQKVSDRTMVSTRPLFCFVGFGTDRLRRQEAMKIAGGENPNHGVAWPRNRAHGAEEQNKSRSIKWAAKQNKFRPKGMCFFLTSPFIELTRHLARRQGRLLVIRGFTHLVVARTSCQPHSIGSSFSLRARPTSGHLRAIGRKVGLLSGAPIVA